MPGQDRSVAFHEVQKFREWWVWLLVCGGIALAWYGFIQQIVFGEPFGTNPAPDWAMWLILLAIGIGLPAFFYSLTLIVEVTGDRILIRYAPVLRRTIHFEEIESYAVRTYSPIWEYGGWGIRGWGHGKRAYNVSGNRGVDIKLRDGNEILIGSQQPEKLAQALPPDRRRSI